MEKKSNPEQPPPEQPPPEQSRAVPTGRFTPIYYCVGCEKEPAEFMQRYGRAFLHGIHEGEGAEMIEINGATTFTN